MDSPSLKDTAIVFGAGEETLWATLCAMQSIMTHHAHEPLDFHILHTGISTTLQHILTALFLTGHSRLNFIDVGQKASALRLHTHPRWKTRCFYRCYLPVLFRDSPRVLWLDEAPLVTGPLTPLLHRFPVQAGIGAVADPLSHMLHQHDVPIHTLLGDGPAEGLADMPFSRYLRDHLGLTRPEGYFNSGMLLLNPKKLSPAQINRCFTLATRPYLCPGTDILNQVFHDHVHLLPERWNFLTGKLTETLCLHLPENWKTRRESERLHRTIIQFPEGAKPWQDTSQPGASHYRQISSQLEKRLGQIAPALIRSLCSQPDS